MKNKAIPKNVHFYYLNWLRYYLDFCEKYYLNELEKENIVHFIKKLREKRRNAQQQKQAYHAISIFYELTGPLNLGKAVLLEDQDGKLATKKEGLRLTKANWAPV